MINSVFFFLKSVFIRTYLNLKRLNLRFLVVHAECLTVRLTERWTVRLPVRPRVRQGVRRPLRQTHRHESPSNATV